MGVLQTISCDVKGCTARKTETHYGSGWPGWGGVHGVADDKTGESPMLCPDHLKVIMNYVITGGDNGMD